MIKWLTSLELEEHCPAFQQKGITGKNLAALTAADLDEMGVKKLGPKKKLLKSLRELGSPKEQRYKLPTGTIDSPPEEIKSFVDLRSRSRQNQLHNN